MDIQVVGWLIQQQNIRIRKQCLRQQHPQFPARCNLSHQAKVIFLGNTRFQQNIPSTAFRTVSIQLSKLGFQMGNLHAILFRHLRQRVDTIALLLHFPQFSIAHNNGINNAVLFKSKLILAKNTQLLARRNRDVARGRRQLSAQDFHEGRFTTAVRTDQTITVTIAEFSGDVFKQRLSAKLHSDVRRGDQRDKS